MALSIPDECPHLIVFDDTDRENFLFSGAGARSAALKTWEQISMSWNAHLFVRVERNSRDDRYPSASTSPPAPVAVRITLQQVLKAYDYAESHPHKYLRGTTNWCAAVAHELNACLDKVKELNQ